MFSRDNPYHRSLVSANTPKARRNQSRPKRLGPFHFSFAMRFAGARLLYQDTSTSSHSVIGTRISEPATSRSPSPAPPSRLASPRACLSRAPPRWVCSVHSRGGWVECQEVSLLTVTCFDKLWELPPGSPLPFRVTGRIIPSSLFNRVLYRQDPSSSAWYRLGPRRSGPLWVIRQCHPPKRAGGETARTFDECPPAGSNL